MTREKKPRHKIQMTDGKRNIIQQLLQEHNIQTTKDIQEALKDLLGGTIKEMVEADIILLLNTVVVHNLHNKKPLSISHI